MLRPRMRHTQEVKKVIIGPRPTSAGIRLLNQLPAYGGFRGYGIRSESGRGAVPDMRTYFADRRNFTLLRRRFRWGISGRRARYRRCSERRAHEGTDVRAIARTFNAVHFRRVSSDAFGGYGGRAAFLYSQESASRNPALFVGAERRKGRRPKLYGRMRF